MQRLQVSASFLSTKSDSLSFSNVGTEEKAPEIEFPQNVWNMLDLILEKSSKAARGRKKELHSRLFSQFSFLPSLFVKSCMLNIMSVYFRQMHLVSSSKTLIIEKA
jgi:hypothetical protein